MRRVIEVSGVRKTYGSMVAVDDVSLDVEEGEIFGLIGPNGAGKTTTMECIEGLRTPDRGVISVLVLMLSMTSTSSRIASAFSSTSTTAEAHHSLGGGRPLGFRER